MISSPKLPIAPGEFSMRTACQALTEKGFIPAIDPGNTIHYLEIGNDEGLSSVPFFDPLRAYGVVTEPFQDEAEYLIILLWRRYKPFSGKIGLTPEEMQVVQNATRHAQHTILLCFANPWMASDIPAEGTLFAFSPSPIFQQAVAECLMGNFEPTGKLPIKL